MFSLSGGEQSDSFYCIYCPRVKIFKQKRLHWTFNSVLLTAIQEELDPPESEASS